MTPDEIRELLLMATVTWPNHPQPSADALALVWSQALADLPYQAIKGALVWWIAEESWFPTPGQIRERAERLIDGHVRRDSFPFRTGLDQAVRRALETNTPLSLTGPEDDDRVLEIAG